MSDKPAYRDKHKCDKCDTGYLDCAGLNTLNLMCCADCRHPTRWTTDPPYTADEIADMQARATKPLPTKGDK